MLIYHTEKGQACTSLERAWEKAVTGWSTVELWAIGKYFSRFLLSSTHCRSSNPYHLWPLWWRFVMMNYVSLSGMFIFVTSVWKFCLISTGVLTPRALLCSFGVFRKCLQIDRLVMRNGITWSLKMCLSDPWKCCHLIYAMDFFNCEIFQINKKE